LPAQTCTLTAKEEDKISQVIDRVLTQVFGKEATNLIYKYLERNHSVRRDEIAEKIDAFAKGLEEFLSSGAYVVERKILEDVYSNYGSIHKLEFKSQPNCDFVNQIRTLQQA